MASKYATTIKAKNGIGQCTKILRMTVLNSQIICNRSNEKRDMHAPKRICSDLEEQLADSTSKTLHLGNSKSKDTTVQGLYKLLTMSVSIFKNIS